MVDSTPTSNGIVGSQSGSEPVVVPRAPLKADTPASISERKLGSQIKHETRMVHARLGLVAGLFVALRAKHSPAASHSLRVAFWASAWGIHHQLNEEQLQLFEMVGLLHEIGKIGIPDRVLQKPTVLSANEQAMMELHPEVGAEILRAAGASEELLCSVRAVGTRYDESLVPGSPVVPMASQLINILDAFDSMTSRHVYRDAMSREHALAELLRLGGSQFDAKLTRSFADIVLHPRAEVEDKVQRRWISHLDGAFDGRFFQLDTTDVSHRVCASRGVLTHYLSDTFHRHMLDHIPDGVIFVDSEFQVLDWNIAAERLTGMSAESVLHQRWTPEFASLCDHNGTPIEEDACPISSLIYHGKKDRQRFIIQREQRPPISVLIEIIPVRNERGALCGGAMIMKDISEQAVLEEKIVHLREQASVDQLTKVANRGELNRQLPEFVNYHLQNNVPGSVIICDIDFFKKINDRFSHQAGDEALKVFASVLRDTCRETDFVARYGGEEFVMLCSECDLTAASEIAESLRRKLQRTPIPDLRNSCITASFGVTSVQPGDTDEVVLGRADRGLLIAKESGRDRVVSLGIDIVPQKEAPKQTTNGWMHWLGLGALPSILECELICSVPRDVALQKFKGFVHEMKAEVVQVAQDKAVIDVDFRHAPIAKADDERLGKFRLQVSITEVELIVGRNKESVQICTLFKIEINPTRNRDRRKQSAINQALKLKQAVQCCMIARDLDDASRKLILRRINNSNDSRY